MVALALLVSSCARCEPEVAGTDAAVDLGAVGDATLDAAADATDGAMRDAEVEPSVPCTTPDARCEARQIVDGEGHTLPYFRTHPLEVGSASIERLVVVVHGTNRDADDYFDRMVRVAGEEGALGTTAILAPHFLTDPTLTCSGLVDAPAPTDLYFGCNGWKHGDFARNAAGTDAYAALAALVVRATGAFPSLSRITFVGHSAGGQLVQRFASVNALDGGLVSVPVRYVVANPSSYLTLDARRLRVDAACVDANDCSLGLADFEAPYFDAPRCPDYDEYPYGLLARYGAAAAVDDATLVARYVARDVVLLLGALDADDSTTAGYADLDTTCAAMAQGPSAGSFRLQRGLTHHAHATLLGATHGLAVVPGCGHSKTCMFESAAGRTAVFGD